VSVGFTPQRPLADMHVGVRLARVREAEAAARRALVVLQPAHARVAQCDVGEEQLCWRETARVGIVERRARTKERDLKTERGTGIRL
jgi:hypothetical protein